MKALALLIVLLAQTAIADTFNYQLFYDEDKAEALDIKMELILSGKFEKGSKVQALKIWGEDDGKPVLLFNIKGSELVASWKSKNVLALSSKMNHDTVVKKEYIAYHSDTNINPGEEYSFDSLVMDQNGTLENDVEGFFLGNQTVEEMALNGFLKKI